MNQYFSHKDVLKKTAAGGYDRQQYNCYFEVSLADRNNPLASPSKQKLTYQAHLFSGRGEIIKDDDDRVERVWKNWSHFGLGISFILGDKVLHAETTLPITDMPKITEVAVSEKPYVLPNYENISLSDKQSLISFIPYAYGTKDGDIYQRPPSDWKTNWKSYYKGNHKIGNWYKSRILC